MGSITSLQGAWLMNGTAGNSVADISTVNTNTLLDTNANVAGTAGQFDNARFFDGATDFLEITNGAQVGLNLNGLNFSLGFWHRTQNTGNNNRTFVSKAGVGGSQGYYVNRTDTNNFLRLRLDATNGDSATALFINTAQHVTVVYDSANAKVFHYFDGVSDASVAMTAAPTDTTDNFRFGENASSQPDGWIDEAFLFTRVLTTAEIRSLASDGLTSYINAAAAPAAGLSSFVMVA